MSILRVVKLRQLFQGVIKELPDFFSYFRFFSNSNTALPDPNNVRWFQRYPNPCSLKLSLAVVTLYWLLVREFGWRGEGIREVMGRVTLWGRKNIIESCPACLSCRWIKLTTEEWFLTDIKYAIIFFPGHFAKTIRMRWIKSPLLKYL